MYTLPLWHSEKVSKQTWKKCFKLTYTHILFLPLYQYCKLILRQSALNSDLLSYCFSWFLSSLFPNSLCGFLSSSWLFCWGTDSFHITLYIGLCLYMYIWIHIYTHRHIDVVLGTRHCKLSIVTFVLI